MQTYGLIVVLAVLVGVSILGLELSRKRVASWTFGFGMLPFVVLFGFLGAKLAGIFDDPSKALTDPIRYLKDPGGHASWGAVLLGSLAMVIIARSQKIPVLVFLDALGLALLAGFVIGRIACHVTADGCYGVETELPWGWIYHPGEKPRHPTPLYESAAALLGFLGLWKLRTRGLQPGILFVIYLFVHWGARFFIEFVRLNPRYGGLSQAQWFSLGLLALAIGLSVKIRKTARKLSLA